MSERGRVGMNGEPDDFAARYDKMAGSRAAPRMWRYLALAAIALLLLVIIDSLIR